MIPNTQIRVIKSKGISNVASFGLSIKNSAHIMTILRDTLYSNKKLAILREYSSNAWDAHHEAGKADVPIRVDLPTYLDLTLKIRDFGKGLSHQEVFEVFTQYGESTKRDTNDAIGMLGIGSKSGFAYSDSFTITSWHNSEKRSYVAVLDPSDCGEIKLLDVATCGDETGIEIAIPINAKDVNEFQTLAQEFFKYFDPPPIVNIPLVEFTHGMKLEGGEIFEDNEDQWVAVMGCVPYVIDLNQVPDLGNLSRRVKGAIHVKIGEIQVSASRESLKYGESTQIIIAQKINNLIDAYLTKLWAELDNPKLTHWNKRLMAQRLRYFNKEVPNYESTINPLPKANTFVLSNHGHKNHISNLYIKDNLTFYVQDSPRAMTGYSLPYYSVVVRPVTPVGKNKKATVKEVLDELTVYLESARLTGIPVKWLSEQNWTAPRRTRSQRNPAPKGTFFQYLGIDGQPRSQCWETTDKTPEDTDIFVILEEFIPKMPGYFFSAYQRANKICSWLGRPIPIIYGYKSTPKKVVEDDECKGTSFEKWYNSIKLLAETKAEELGLVCDDSMIDKSRVDFIEKYLGEDHIIVKFFKKVLQANEIDIKTEFAKTNEEVIKNQIIATYDLLKWQSSLTYSFIFEQKISWLTYVQMVDKLNAIKEKTKETGNDV